MRFFVFHVHGAALESALTDEHNTTTSPPEPAHTYTFEYETINLVKKVIDPAGASLYQEFTTTCYGALGYSVETNYRDRRGSMWRYESYRPDPINNHQHFQLSAIENPLDEIQTFDFNTANLLAEYRDALGRGWSYVYDAMGNRLSAEDYPVNNRDHAWTYDQYNNVLTYADPLGNVTTYRYHYQDNPPPATGYPTLLTKITEPPALPGGNAADTVMEYFIGDGSACAPDAGAPPDECKHGLLKRVLDPNLVYTLIDYDTLGQRLFYGEGVRHDGDEDESFDYVYRDHSFYDSRSRMFSSNWDCASGVAARGGTGGSGGDISSDSKNNRTNVTCIGVFSGLIDPPTPPPYLPQLPSNSVGPQLPLPSADWSGVYDGLGRLKNEKTAYEFGPNSLLCNYVSCEHLKTNAYNELNLRTAQGTTLDEQDASISRNFAYTHLLDVGANGHALSRRRKLVCQHWDK